MGCLRIPKGSSEWAIVKRGLVVVSVDCLKIIVQKLRGHQ